MYAGNIHHQSPSYIKIQCVFISLSTSVKKNTATMYSFTKTSSTSPALVGTPSQYTLTDQTNYVHFFWALDRGNTFGKLEMMIVIQVQTLSWQFAEATKGARLMHPGYEQQNGRCWSESNFAIYPKDSFWGCFFLLYPFWKCEWNGWKLVIFPSWSHLCVSCPSWRARLLRFDPEGQNLMKS